MSRLLGYSDRFSAAPGETIAFKVSCTDGAADYRAEIVRLTCTDDHPDGPGRRETPVESPVNGRYPARRQPLRAGSYGLVPAAPVLDALTSFTLQVVIWPTSAALGRQGLVTRWNEASGTGFGLFIEDGCAALRLGRGEGEVEILSSGKALIDREWYRLTARYDAADGRAQILQEPLADNPVIDSRATADRAVGRGAFRHPQGPLLMAAWQEDETEGRLATGGHYNGKLEAPRLAAGWHDGEAFDALASWDFSRDIGSDRLIDSGTAGLHGRAVNLPTRAVTGHDWTGETQRWRDRPDHYGAIHFHDDDLADAGWETDFTLTVPETLSSGVYGARLTSAGGADIVPFVVRPRTGEPGAPVAFLASAATYTAYANTRLAMTDPLDEIERGALYEFFEADLYLQEHPELGLSLYDQHFDGSPVLTASRLRPVLNLRPGTRLWNFNADMMIVDWLTARGFAHDVITDEDLDREGPALLAPYRALVTGSHPEYFSDAMLGAVRSYRDGGGRLAYLGGNGFYWRISFHPDEPGIIECRKTEGVRNWDLAPGERDHAFDGQPGGLWRSLGQGPQGLVGVGTTAFGFDRCGSYRRTPGSFDPRAAFIFEGIGPDEVIGDFGLVGDGAAGVEIDRHDRALGTPAHALVVARSQGLSRSYMPAPEEQPYLHPAMAGDENARVCAEMVFFEAPRGGAVFATGSIAWATSLCHQGYANNVARITENVLRRFLDPAPFV